MSRFCPLFSSSAGNCMLFGSAQGNILIDIGVSARKTEEALRAVGVDPRSLRAILITHEHIDHVRGLKTFTGKYDVPVYASAGTLQALCEKNVLHARTRVNVIPFTGMEAAGIFIQAFPTMHDCKESVGYRLTFAGGQSAVLATDLGRVTEEVRTAMQNCHLLILESNHDVRMLQTGRYPYPTKQRILSDVGHLSNESCACELPSLVRQGTARLVLAHLSQDNNMPQLALQASIYELQANGLRQNYDYRIAVAPKDGPGATIYF